MAAALYTLIYLPLEELWVDQTIPRHSCADPFHHVAEKFAREHEADRTKMSSIQVEFARSSNSEKVPGTERDRRARPIRKG